MTTTTPTTDPRIAEFREARAAMGAALAATDAAFAEWKRRDGVDFAASDAYQDAAAAALAAMDAYAAARERL